MAEFYLSVQTPDNRLLCIAPLTDRTVAASGQQIADQSGYFLYEKSAAGLADEVHIIAHLLSTDAALRVATLLNMR